MAWVGPPDDCRIPPKNRTIAQEIRRLVKDANTLDDAAYIKRLVAFVKLVGKDEATVLMTAERLKCMQDWAAITERADIEFRKEIGAPSSKSIVEEIRAASAKSAASGESRVKQNENR